MKQVFAFFALLILILLTNSCSKDSNSSSGNGWKTASPMPTARHHFGFVEQGGLLYAIGGYDASGINAVEVYNPSDDSWQPKSPMPTARGYLVVAAVSGKIYAIGGITGSDLNNITYTNVTEEYDPATDQWTEKSPFPISGAVNSVIGNQFIAGTAINGKIYVAAGSAGVTEPAFIYDPVMDAWQTDASIAIGKFNLQPYFSTACNNDLYITDGDYFLSYSSSGNSWHDLQPFSTSRQGVSLASDGTYIYSIGGYELNTPASMTNEVGKYSVSGSSWTKTSGLNVKRHSAGAVVYNGNLYVAGGAVQQANYQDTPLTSMEVLKLK